MLERATTYFHYDPEEIPDYNTDPDGFFSISYGWIDRPWNPPQFIHLLWRLNKTAHQCKVEGRISDQSKLLALKREALYKLSQLRALGDPNIKISSYVYWDKEAIAAKERAVFSIRKSNGEFFATEAPRETLDARFDEFLKEYDRFPPGVKKNKLSQLAKR